MKKKISEIKKSPATLITRRKEKTTQDRLRGNRSLRLRTILKP